MKLKFIVFVLMACSFASCIDLTEYFTINEDGSGVYEQKMDMTRALTGLSEMMESAGGGKSSSTKKKEKVDTVIYYASIVDTVSTLSAEQKNVFKKAYAKIHVDEANNEIVMNILFPFASPKEFNIIQTVMADNKAYGSISDIMLGALGSKNKQLAGGNGENAEDKPSTPTRDYVYTLTGTSLSRKVIEKKDTETKSEEELPEQMKELMKMNIKTVIKLPRPIKQSSGSNLTVSDNKKEATFFKNVDLNTKFAAADFDFSLDY